MTLAEKNRLLAEMAAAEAADSYVPRQFAEAVKVKFIGLFSMHDQKTTAALCGCSSMQKCPFCFAGPVDFMKNDVAKFVVKSPEFLEFGVSPLHFSMRCMEFLFKMGFNSDFCDWYVSCC